MIMETTHEGVAKSCNDDVDVILLRMAECSQTQRNSLPAKDAEEEEESKVYVLGYN